MSLTRRNFLKTLGGVALGALPPNARPDHAGAGATSPQADWCGVGDQGQPLFVPGERGFLGRLVLGKETLTLRHGDLVVIDTCGGGGFGPPAARPAAARERDRREGYV